VSHNSGLVVVRGRAARITLANLRVSDTDNVDAVTVHLRSGLRHGTLSVRGKKGSTEFTLMDMERGVVVYLHDGSDSGDRIILRITDGRFISVYFYTNACDAPEIVLYLCLN